jgi:shikimate kinase
VTGPSVLLVGPPGAGVAEAGRRLGELLGLPVRDTDTEVEAAAGMPVPEIFVDLGEAAFRELERAAVALALAEHRGVLVVGGGALSDPVTAAALTEAARADAAPVVFLDVSITDAAKRLGFNRDRPPGLGSPRSAWLKQMEQRRPVYQRVATLTVPTDGLSYDQVAQNVLAALRADQAGPQQTGSSEQRTRSSEQGEQT